MWSPRWVLLLLALVLIPDPGASQFGIQNKKICSDCKGKVMDTDDEDMFQRMIDGEVEDSVKCPLQSNARFQLKNGTIVCGKRHLTWVKKIIECYNEDKCLQYTSSNHKKEPFQGTNEKPFTTTVNAPTTAPVNNLKPSTQSWDNNIGHSTEPTEAGAARPTTSLVATIRPDSNNANIDSRQGDKSQEPTAENSKMKHMQIAIISLILIVLAMVAVGVGLYCRKKKKNEFNSSCNPIGYTPAPSEDSIDKDKNDKWTTAKDLHCTINEEDKLSGLDV